MGPLSMPLGLLMDIFAVFYADISLFSRKLSPFLIMLMYLKALNKNIHTAQNILAWHMKKTYLPLTYDTLFPAQLLRIKNY